MPPDSPIFILTEKEARARGLWGHRLLKPWFKNSDIAPGAVNNTPERYLLYLDRSSALEAVIAEHLQPVRPLLEARREVQAGAMQWWQLHWPRSPEIFDNPKLVVPQRHRRNLRVEQRHRGLAGEVEDDFDVLAGGVEDLHHRRVGQQFA